MKNNLTVLFLFLFVASIGVGMALRNTINYSMVFGVALALVFLLTAAFFLWKEQ
jgi:hypothetical protein